MRDRIAAEGPLPWSAVQEVALYHPDHGFYAGPGRAGRRGDFLTSPEVGPLFGAVVARALDAGWERSGRPSTFVVVEVGAGPGTLAAAIRAADPACGRSGALRYLAVERSAAQRALHRDLESHEDLAGALAAGGGRADVVLANELLDNLPVDLAERTADGWAEVRVDVVEGQLTEVLGPPCTVPPAVVADPGARVPRQAAAQAWLAEALAAVGERGRVLLFDYAATTAELATRPQADWLRTYRAHAPGVAPLEALGEQDITCEVCVDQLAAVAPPVADRPQADWLRAHGIEDLVAEGRRTWQERAHLGDLAAIRARSRVSEAEALLDPRGLGAFRALEW